MIRNDGISCVSSSQLYRPRPCCKSTNGQPAAQSSTPLGRLHARTRGTFCRVAGACWRRIGLVKIVPLSVRPLLAPEAYSLHLASQGHGSDLVHCMMQECRIGRPATPPDALPPLQAVDVHVPQTTQGTDIRTPYLPHPTATQSVPCEH